MGRYLALVRVRRAAILISAGGEERHGGPVTDSLRAAMSPRKGVKAAWARCISPICAIRPETSSAPCIAWLSKRIPRSLSLPEGVDFAEVPRYGPWTDRAYSG